MAGQRLGHYEVLEKLGEGGMGVVYRAFDIQLRREVAIKLLPEACLQDPEKLARFKREALLLASLNHTNIVAIHSIDKADGVPFIVMELVEGQPLSEMIPKGGLDLDVFFKLAVQIADAISVAHSHGIQHRDLKPGNLMVTADGTIKIADFGLGCFFDPRSAPIFSEDTTQTEVHTAEGAILGTPPYMSPEQFEGKQTDPRSDIFALGVVMYEMVTGKRPFGGKSSAALITSILRDTPTPISETRSDVPRHLSRIINQCLAKKPDRRFQMAQDLRNSLMELETEVISGEAFATSSMTRRNLLPGRALVVLALVLVVVFVGLAGMRLLIPKPPGSDEISVAVLPFKSLGPSGENDYIGDGVTEDIISLLSTFPDLAVISSTSVMQYKNSLEPTAKIGRELGATHLLEGSLRREGDQIRIVSRLVDTANDDAVWAGTFDRSIESLFDLQSDVSQKIVSALKGQLTEAEEEFLSKPGPAWQTHELYLRGRHFLGQRTEAGMRTALSLFEQATEEDPGYAAAWAAKAETLSLLGTYGLEPTQEAHRRAYEAADQALSVDPTSAEAHYALGVAAFNRWEWETAERSFGRALELKPNLASAHHYYAYYLVTRGRTEEAIRHIETARRLDPASPTTQLSVGAVYFLARQYSVAIEQIETAVEMYPESARAHAALAGACAFQGSLDRAVAALNEALRLGDGSPEIAATQITVLALVGKTDEAERLLTVLTGPSRPRRISPGDAASANAVLGHTGQALRWLEIGFDERDPVLAYLAVDPGFDALRKHRDFESLLIRVGLKE